MSHGEKNNKDLTEKIDLFNNIQKDLTRMFQDRFRYFLNKTNGYVLRPLTGSSSK
jgi:hypothetical protein